MPDGAEVQLPRGHIAACPGTNAVGRCWGLPTCGNADGQVSQCNGGGGNDCINECAAIEGERVFYPDALCP